MALELSVTDFGAIPESVSLNTREIPHKAKNASLQNNGVINGQSGRFHIGDDAPKRSFSRHQSK